MQDRLFEAQTFPTDFPLKQFRRPVILAPHPDDEVFGCGGLLALWANEGVHAKVVVLTGGQAQGEGIERELESRTAAALLGNYCLDFWSLSDRELRTTPMLVQRIADYLKESQADILLVPALHEPHPDHQACALAGLWSLERLPKIIDLCFYESGTALVHCTHVVDITSVQMQKMQAMHAFNSQEDVQPYSSRIAALNHFRALTLGPHAQAAEAFQWFPLVQNGWPALLSGLDPLFLHQRGQAVWVQDLPLVTVLIRTTGDPRLEQAIASVCLQNYAQLEIVVVAAHGELQPPVWADSLTQDIRWVSVGEALTRPQAANLALDNAHGKYCIFLDDDDLFTSGHIDKLVQGLRPLAGVYAIHTDTQVIDAQSNEVLRYDRPYQSQRLIFSNTFPIHSVLFERSLVTVHGCRFDESLPVLEDWDFWLQVSMHTTFAHVAGCSAIYRYNDRSQLQGDAQHPHHHLQLRQQVMLKWQEHLPADKIAAAGAWYAQQLDHAEQHWTYVAKKLAQAQQVLERNELDKQLAEQRLEFVQHGLQQALQEKASSQQELQDARQMLQHERALLNSIYHSRGWRLLTKLRYIKEYFWRGVPR